MRNKIAGLLAAMAIAIGLNWANALDFKTIENRGVYKLYAARTSSVSTHTVSGVGIAWSVYTVGGSADFTIKYSTINNGDPNVNASSKAFALNGVPMGDVFKAIVNNPVISVDRIDQPGTTIYVDIEYLAPRAPDSF